MRQTLRAFRRSVSPSGLVGLSIVLVVIASAVWAPLLTGHDPAGHNLRARELPPMWLEGGRPEFPLGTDQLGRDLWSRIVYGARVSVIVGTAGTIVALTIGLVLGTLAGYFGGAVDAIVSRGVDTFMAIPFVILAMGVVAVVGPQRGLAGIGLLVVVLGVSGWADFARVARAETLAARGLQFVESAIALGQRDALVLIRHILPTIAAPMIVLGALQVGTVIIAEASLSFLGLGVQPPDVTWGTMLADGRGYVATSWWLALFPGLAITVTVVGSVLLGDWLRDAMDVRSR